MVTIHSGRRVVGIGYVSKGRARFTGAFAYWLERHRVKVGSRILDARDGDAYLDALVADLRSPYLYTRRLT